MKAADTNVSFRLTSTQCGTAVHGRGRVTRLGCGANRRSDKRRQSVCFNACVGYLGLGALVNPDRRLNPVVALSSLAIAFLVTATALGEGPLILIGSFCRSLMLSIPKTPLLERAFRARRTLGARKPLPVPIAVESPLRNGLHGTRLRLRQAACLGGGDSIEGRSKSVRDASNLEVFLAVLHIGFARLTMIGA